jgi:hypothetical protein
LYYFVDDASENPTFYADLSNPQSLNKYQYSYNNPLRYIDPDGHDTEDVEPDTFEPAFQTTTVVVKVGKKVIEKSGKGPIPIPVFPIEDPLDPTGPAACCITDFFVEPSPNRIPQQQIGKDETVAPPAPIQSKSQQREAQQQLGPHGGKRNEADQQRINEQRERRNTRRENRSRDAVGQNRSGEGYRNLTDAKKGPRGERPKRRGGRNRERNVGIDEEHSRVEKGRGGRGARRLD